MASDDIRKRCFVQLKDLAKGLITDQEIESVLDRLEKKRQKRSVNNEDIGDVDASIEDAFQTFDEDRLAALVRQKQVLENAKHQAFFLERLEQASRPEYVIRDTLAGSVKNGFGAASSIDAKARSNGHKRIGGMVSALREAKVYDYIERIGRDQKLQDDIIQEVYNRNGGSNPIDTGNQIAKDVAKVWSDTLSDQRTRMNAAGAYIAPLPGYIMRQSYDRLKLRKAGFEQFKNDMLKNLDESVYLGDPEEYLKHVYEALITGKHEQARGGDSWLTAFVGPQNLAKKLSQHRELHYKDALSWLEIHRKYGNGNIWEALTNQINFGERNIAIMQSLGTNPDNMLNWLVDQIEQRGKKSGDIEAGNKARKIVDRFWDQTNGKANIAENVNLAKIGSYSRQWQAISKLGGMLISSLNDIANQISTYASHNIDVGNSFKESINNLFRGRGSAEIKAFAESVGAASSATNAYILDSFAGSEIRGGKFARAVNWFYKATGINWWVNAHRTGGILLLSENLAKYRHLKFEGIEEGLRNSLERYEIGSKEWDIYTKSKTRTIDGRDFMSPDEVSKLDDDIIREYLGDEKSTKTEINTAREQLAEKLAFYYNDTVSEALSEGNIVQRSSFTAGGSARPGTVYGELLRSFFQFKSFTFNTLYRHWGRILYRGGKGSLIPSALTLLAPSFILGYITYSAKQVLKGLEPPDPTDPSAWAAAMLQSGGMGIFSDFLFASTNRYGNSFFTTLGGPAVGTTEDLYKVFNNIRAGKVSSAGSELVNLIQSNTPFANLFYTQQAANVLIFDHMKEVLNPGVTAETERKNEKQGYSYLFKRSRIVRRGGGF